MLITIRSKGTYLKKTERAAGHPKTRGDCVDGERPCPWVGCRHHLFVDIRPPKNRYKGANIKTHFEQIEDMPETCALDVADRGPNPFEKIAAIIGVTKERVRQYEVESLASASRALKEQESGIETKDFETRARDYDPWQCAISGELDSGSEII